MGLRLVGLVKGVRFAEFGLVVFELLLLLWRQHGEFPLFLGVGWVYSAWPRYGSVFGREVIMIGEVGKHVLLTTRPCEMVVVSNVDHVVCVDTAEGC